MPLSFFICVTILILNLALLIFLAILNYEPELNSRTYRTQGVVCGHE